MTFYPETKNEESYSTNHQWFAIQTHAQKEIIAKVNFENQGYKVYLPQVHAIRRHARRSERVKRAFFPGYLFLRLGSHDRHWQTIAGTRGVLRPVRFGDYYPPLPDWVVVELRSREGESGLIMLDDDKFKEGDKVKISLHSDVEHSGIFKKLHGNERALILLDILQEQAKAVVPLSALSLC